MRPPSPAKRQRPSTGTVCVSALISNSIALACLSPERVETIPRESQSSDTDIAMKERDRTMLRRLAVAIGFGTLVCGAEVFAQTAPKVFVSPNKGQSQDQQNRDTADCQQCATQQAPPSQPASGAGTHTRGAVGGAARGAAAGAAVGAIAGDAGTGAGAGAVVGGVA